MTLTNENLTAEQWDAVIAANTDLTAVSNGVQWPSGNAAKEIVGLPDGTYTLKETGNEFEAKNGKTYLVVTDTLTFTLEKGKVTNVTGAKDAFGSKTDDGYFYYNADSDANQNYIAVCDAEKPKVTEGTTTTTKETTSETTTVSTGTSVTTSETEVTTEKTTSKTTAETGTSATTSETEVTTITVQDVVIAKKDITGKTAVKGAKLTIKDAEDKLVDSWTSDGTDHTIAGDKFTIGETYTLEETAAPNGYVYADSITFTVGEDGTITVDAANVDENGVIVMKDDVTKVSISKKDITGDNEIPGATLQIKDENGDVVEEWTSTDKPHEINGKLTAGKEYTLHEENAPNGYAYSEDVKFTVDKTGKVTKVTMNDDVTKVSINKKTLTGSDELAGAELKLYYVTKNEQGETVETEVDAWTSGTEAHVINGKLIAGGKYKLVEVTAPDGYQVAEAVTFTVNKDNSLTEVTMRDAAEGEIAISKQSVNSTDELEGAKLKITDATGKTVAEWVSEKTPKLVQLDAGTYTLTEETAPDGYVLAESMTFTVDKNGKVTVKNENGEDVDAGGIIVMKDNTTKVSISKQDITGDKEIPGAKLQVKDETGKVIEEWTSTDKPHEINEKLVAGKTYTLHEEGAPDGYTYAEDVEFTVDEKGKVTTVVM